MKKVFSALLVLAILFTSTVMAFGATAGDVNSDGKVNSTDALAILQYTVGKPPSKFDKGVADLNSDGKINSTDALKVLQIAVGSAQAPSVPKSVAEIVDYYNNAVAKAVNAKVGFTKNRKTDNEKMDGSVALKAMKSLVYQFMGIGAENEYNETVTKGKWGDVAFLFNSKLTAADVTSATCTQSGANYVITLKLKNGASSAGQSNPTTAPNTALDKCGICVGTEDKNYYDHKTASVIYSAISGMYAGAEIKENYSNAMVKATINSSTGNIVSIVVEWDQNVTLSKLAGMSATASGVSHVTYKNFKY